MKRGDTAIRFQGFLKSDKVLVITGFDYHNGEMIAHLNDNSWEYTYNLRLV